MRMSVQLPKIGPEACNVPKRCPYAECDGECFKRHGVQGEMKLVRDLHYDIVRSYRWRCLKCGRRFRMYPPGVSGAQQSARLKGFSILLYVLGLSYGGVADALESVGCGISKTTVYNNVQQAGTKARERQRGTVAAGGKRAVIGADGTFVRVKGKQMGVEVVVDDESGELLGLEIIVSENAEDVLQIVQDVAEEVEADVIVSDDLDVYKIVADELGKDHQICRSHVKRNVDELAESIQHQLKKNEPLPKDVDSSPQRLQTDLENLQRLVRERPKNASTQLEHMYHRYKAAPTPKKGQRHTVWYRMRMLVTRLWERWPRLTLDQRRAELDGTNNSCERLIGWWIKERYRTMRGYKRTESIKNVATLTARMGVRSGNYDMTELYS